MDNRCRLTPPQIVMYTTDFCSDCQRAKALFEANHIFFELVSVENNDEATQFILDLNHGYRSVPTIIFPDGSILVEPSWEDLTMKFNIHNDT